MVFGGYLTKEALVGKLCCRDWFLLSLTLTYAAPEDTMGRGVGMTEISARYLRRTFWTFYLVSKCTMDGQTQGPNLQM